jgi:Carboxypeptidase regulatory-like domain/TonB dependent receptor
MPFLRCALNQGALAKSLSCFVLVLLSAPRCRSQAVAVAEIDGHVQDPFGQYIASAQIKLTETDTQQIHQTVSDAQGRYALPNLPVGNYQLEIVATGFKTYIQQGIVVQVANNVELNVTMQIGTVSESIEVTAAANMVETKDNAISQVIDQKRIVDLPLNGRNPTQLITLTGAGTSTPGGDLTGSKNIQGSNGSGTFSVAGGQANGINYLLDGGDNNDAFSNVNLPLPFPDALQEFSVQTNALPAQFGLHPGGVVNAVTRSGSNSFHGDLFEFLRNGDFNARQEGTLARDTLKRSQFGGVFGGRIIRDKLFFFGGYQGTRQRSTPPTQISFIPNQTVLTTGNFGLYTTPTAQGGCLGSSTPQVLKSRSGAVFPNNIVPVNQFDPAAVLLATKYLPATSNPCGEVQYGIPANNPDDQWIGRVDYVKSDKHSMYGRYYIYDYTAPATFNGSNVLTTTTAGNQDRSQTATFGDTYSFGPTMLNSFHATFNRRRDDRGSAPNLISPATLGVDINQLLPNFIDISVGSGNSYFGAGCGTCAPGYFNVNNYQVSDDFTIIRGKHQFGFGVDIRRLQLNIENNQQSNGQFNFDGSISGNALADFLLGYMSTYNQGNPNPNALRQTVFAAYAQDTFRVSPRFTLNLGVRWEPNLPPVDAFSRGGQFQLAGFLDGVHSTVYPNAPAGMFFAGDKTQNPYGAALTRNHWLSTSPRIGLVWDPKGDGKQTIRSAFALMHDTTELFFPERLTTNPPYASSVTLNNVQFSNPWAGQPGGNPFPGASIFPLAGTYVNIPPNLNPTYMMQWNISYQRQVSANWLVTVNYLGNATRHIWGARDINAAQYIPGNCIVSGKSSPCSTTKNTNQRRGLYLIDPSQGQYYSSIVQADDGGVSSYNGLLFSVQHRFAQHFTLLSNYTWSHCISDIDFQGELAGTLYQNQNNRAGEKGSCIYDHRSIFNTSLVALSSGFGSGFAKTVTANWQLSPIITASSGAPFTITDGSDVSLTAGGNDRPNQVLPNATPAQQGIKSWFNQAAFQKQPTGTFGDVGRTSLNQPGSWNIDLALSRIFRITERWNVEARADAFNVLNHGNWMLFSSGTTSQSITSSTFGQITMFSSPRIIQLALKVSF